MIANLSHDSKNIVFVAEISHKYIQIIRYHFEYKKQFRSFLNFKSNHSIFIKNI